MNSISMKLNADKLIMQALEEDITSEDVTTNAVMRHPQQGEVQLLCKQDGVIAGLDVFKRVFELLDETTQVVFYVKDGDAVKKWRSACSCKGGYPCPAFRRTHRLKLLTENERYCNVYTLNC